MLTAAEPALACRMGTPQLTGTCRESDSHQTAPGNPNPLQARPLRQSPETESVAGDRGDAFLHRASLSA